MNRHRAASHKRHALLAAAALALGACGGESTYTPDPSVLPSDEVQRAVYPSGPYGKDVGNTVEDHTFSSVFYDSMVLCKPMDQQDLPINRGPAKLAWADLFRGHELCAERPLKLMWIMVGAGYCSACKSQLQSMAAKVKNGQVDKRVLFVNASIAGLTQGSAVTPEFLWEYARTLGLTFPQIVDTERHVRKYFTETSIPLNLAVDLTTMKIIYKKAGSATSVMDSTIQSHFAGK